MKLITFPLCVLLFASSALYGQSKKELKATVEQLNTEIEQLKKPKEADISTDNKKVSYALGVVVGSNIESQELDSLDLETLLVAIEDVFSDRELKLSQEDAELAVQEYMQKQMEAKKTKKIDEAAAFLTENKAKEGVQVTESGLQYRVLKEGSGESPAPTDKVTVHYKGMLTDGTVFDSSIERGEPVTFGVNQVIPGWTEALQLMQEGDKWELYIPYPLAYGERGAGGQIPPFSTLVFEVELLDVQKSDAPKK